MFNGRILVLPRMLVVAAMLASLPSCQKAEEESAGVVKFTSAEVATLLGLEARDGITVGDVESGREGVKVKSISIKNGDDTEVEIDDVDLRIESTGKLQYAITHLKVGKIDILDWKTTQRAQAFGVTVEKPGPGFLTKLQKAVASVRAGGAIKTADLSCQKLSIDRISYVLRNDDASLTKVNIQQLTIADAGTDVLGQFSVDSAGVGERVTGSGLKMTQIDRQWADQLIGLLTARAAEAGTATRPAADQPLSDALPATKPTVKPPVLTKRLFPFDHFEVASLDIDVSGKIKSDLDVVKVTSVRLDVTRNADGSYAGLNGSVGATMHTATFGEEAQTFFRAVGGDAMAQTLSATLEIKSTRSGDSAGEDSSVTVKAPGLATLSVAVTTRQLAEAIAALLTQQEVPDDYVTLSAVTIDATDDGLLAYLLSDRFDKSHEVKGAASELAFSLSTAADEERLQSELSAFVKSPKGVTWKAVGQRYMTVDEFFREMGASVLMQVSFRSDLPPAPAITPDAAAVAADIAAYKAALNSARDRADREFLTAHGVEKAGAWKRAAAAGNTSASLLVGVCYQNGCGVRKDHLKALEWYRKAADAGEPVAMTRIGCLYHDVYSESIKRDHAEAVRWYQRAADKGDAEAMYRLGEIYNYARSYGSQEDRNGVKTDDVLARQWYTRAVDAGSKAAMVQLGQCYRRGTGGSRDDARAVQFFRQAADAGNAEAMRYLSEMYRHGNGVAKDEREADRWLRKAADAGDFGAKYDLEHKKPEDAKAKEMPK